MSLIHDSIFFYLKRKKDKIDKNILGLGRIYFYFY